MRYVAALSALLLVGLLLGASLLVYAAYALVALFFLTRFLTGKWIASMTAEQEMVATEVEIDQSVPIGIKIKNESGWFIPWALIETVLPKRATRLPPIALEVKGAPLRLAMIPAKAQRLLSFVVTPRRRGYFQVGPTIAETGDLLGLHRKYKVLCAPQYLLVLPKIIPLDGYSISSRRPVGEIQVTYRLMEDPTLIAGIREYQTGDPMSKVHWAATARTGKLHSKVHQPTCVAGAMMILDLHRSSNPDRHEPVRSDLAVTAAVSICHTLYLMQQQFGLVTNGRDAADRIRTEGWDADHRCREDAYRSVEMRDENSRLRPMIVPAGRGPEHFHELHQTLARLERTDGMKLPELLIEAQSRLPRDASIVVVVQEVDEQAAMALGMLRRQGYAVSAIVNHFEKDAVLTASGRLLAQRIPVYHLADEASIPYLCRNMLLRY